VKKTSQHKGDAITAFISYITKDKSYIIHGYRRKGEKAQWHNGATAQRHNGVMASMERGRGGDWVMKRLRD